MIIEVLIISSRPPIMVKILSLFNLVSYRATFYFIMFNISRLHLPYFLIFLPLSSIALIYTNIIYTNIICVTHLIDYCEIILCFSQVRSNYIKPPNSLQPKIFFAIFLFTSFGTRAKMYGK